MADVTIFVVSGWWNSRSGTGSERQGLCLLLGGEGSTRQDWSSSAGFYGHCVLFGLELGLVAQDIELGPRAE